MKAVEEFAKELSGDGNDTLLLVRELASTVEYYRRVLERYELDSLTGLPGANKYHEFKTTLAQNLPKSLGAIVFDVNDLKYYNDNKGHQAGDLLLQKAAESFHFICNNNACRKPCDTLPTSEKCDRTTSCVKVRIYRTGGDEFVALIPDCSESVLFEIVADWKDKLVQLNAIDDGIRCTVAYGAAFGNGSYKLGDVLQLADERMYAEKRRMKESGIKLGNVR